MNSEQLKTFVSLLTTGNFTKTAEELYISQSSVSKRIQELEREVGQSLFERYRSGLKLTNAGIVFKGYAEEFLNSEKKVKEQILRSSVYSAYLVIGSTFSFYDMYLSSTVPKFLKDNPDCFMNIKLNHTENLLEDLAKGIIDIAFTYQVMDCPGYVYREISSDELILVTSKKNKGNSDGIKWTELRNLPLIETKLLNSSVRDEIFPPSFQPKVIVDVASYAINLLLDTDWYAIVTRRLAEPFMIKGEITEIPIKGIKLPAVKSYLVYKQKLESNIAVQKFFSYLMCAEK